MSREASSSPTAGRRWPHALVIVLLSVLLLLTVWLVILLA
jgi:hypothetical protein